MKDPFADYLKGEMPKAVKEGRIATLFYTRYEGEHCFMLDDEGQTSSWVRPGDPSWYIVGRRVKIEQITFGAPFPIGERPVVTKI
ncbi:MAG TPA: hypothetical protein VFC07_00120 [Verrucomicrobiae bacterium]|nr:hypothetical protein [Verrucomicrobiae bacterium]